VYRSEQPSLLAFCLTEAEDFNSITSFPEPLFLIVLASLMKETQAWFMVIKAQKIQGN